MRDLTQNHVAWTNPEQTRLRIHLGDNLSMEAFTDANSVIAQAANAVSHPIDVVLVMAPGRVSRELIATVPKLEQNIPPNVDRMVMVGGDRIFFQLTREFMLRYRPSDRLRHRLHFCETEAEAHALLDNTPTPT